MSKEKQIEEMAKCCTYYHNGECCADATNICDCDLMCEMFGVFANLENAGYRKQSEGEWECEVKHFFDDYGDLTVYATAHCSKCEKEYPFNPTIAREYIQRPYDLTGYEDWNVDVEPIKAKVLQRARTNKSLYPFCPNCGAKMKGGAE